MTAELKVRSINDIVSYEERITDLEKIIAYYDDNAQYILENVIRNMSQVIDEKVILEVDKKAWSILQKTFSKNNPYHPIFDTNLEAWRKVKAAEKEINTENRYEIIKKNTLS